MWTVVSGGFAHLKKRDRTVKIAVKLKFLDLDDKQKQALDDYFNEYANAINFCVLKITRMEDNLSFIGRKVDGKWKGEMGKCAICGAEKELMYLDKNKPIVGNICNDCKRDRYSGDGYRKLFVSTKKRKVQKSLDIRKIASLNNTHYHRVVPEAYDFIKAIRKQKRNRLARIKSDRKRLNEFKEMLEDEKKRVARPKRPRERETRYVHSNRVDTKSRGYTLAQIRKKVYGLEKKIWRSERNINKRFIPRSSGNRIELDDDWIKWDLDNSKIKIPSLFKDMEFHISGPKNVKSNKGKEYFSEWFKRIKEQPKQYSYLIRKEKRGIYDYYLQYTYDTAAEQKSKYKGSLGVDIGLSKLAAIAFYDEHEDKIMKPVKVYRNPIKSIKIEYGKLIRKLHKAKIRHVNKKLRTLRKIKNRINYICHNVAKDIVEKAINSEAFITMEALDTGIKEKQKVRETKKQKFSRNMFLFRKLSKLIEYKAQVAGVKVVYVKPEYTSETCSACGTIGKREGQAIFRCINENCKYYKKPINADFNAAANIARKGLNRDNVISIV